MSVPIRSAIGYALAATVAGLFASTAGAQYSSPVRDVENPARTPFTASATVDIPSGFAGVLNSPVATVPAGRRLVIEHVSVRCGTPSGAIVRANIGVTQLTGPSSSTTRAFELPVQFQGTDPFGGRTYVGSLTTRLYSDPGLLGSGGVTGGVIRDTGTGSGFCAFVISGHTIAI